MNVFLQDRVAYMKAAGGEVDLSLGGGGFRRVKVYSAGNFVTGSVDRLKWRIHLKDYVIDVLGVIEVEHRGFPEEREPSQKKS